MKSGWRFTLTASQWDPTRGVALITDAVSVTSAMEAAAEAAATTANKIAGAPTRAILNALRQNGRLTRPQIFASTPRDLIPSIARLTRHLRALVAQKRVKVC